MCAFRAIVKYSQVHIICIIADVLTSTSVEVLNQLLSLEHSGKVASQIQITRLEPCTFNDHLQTKGKSVVPSHLNSDQVDEERHLIMLDFPFAV